MNKALSSSETTELPENKNPDGKDQSSKEIKKPIIQDDVFEDEEIDVSSAQGKTEAEPEGQQEENLEQKPYLKRRGPRRYSTLTRERDEARREAEQLRVDLEAEKRRSEEFAAKATEASSMAMQSYAAKAEADLREARVAHAKAIESSDPEKITEAAERLASAKSAVDDVEAWKPTQKGQQAKPAQQQQPQQRQQQQFQIPDLPPETTAWIVENRYFDTIARDRDGDVIYDSRGRPKQNPDYDPKMHHEAASFARTIEEQIEDGDLNIKVSSPEYFKLIENHMEKKFPDYFLSDENEEEEEEEQQKIKKSSPVAGPSRSVTMDGKTIKKDVIKLTADQIRFVKKMVDNGGGPKYPEGHPKQFQPMTFHDAKISYALRARSMAK